MKHNWEYKKLGDVCRIEFGTRVVQKKDGGSTYDVYGGGGATFKMDRYNREDCFIVSRFAMSPKCTRYVKGKFFLNDSGLSVSTNIHELSQAFVDSFLLANNDKIYAMGKGAAQRNLDMAAFRKMSIPVPSLSEQSRIVAELDLLTGIIDKQNAQLKELDNLAQAIFYDMFGDPIENEKGWYIKTLENIGKCVSGGTPSRKNAEFFEGNINWYSAGELNSLYLEESVEKITEAALKESAAKLCKANSLFIGMYDTAAFKLGITKTEAASNQACANVFPKEDNVIWLYFVLSIMRDEALKCRHGARQKNLNLGFIKSFSVPVPPLALQQSFAEKIQSIEKQKETIRASIADTQKLLDYTMDKYFG